MDGWAEGGMDLGIYIIICIHIKFLSSCATLLYTVLPLFKHGLSLPKPYFL